MTINKTFSKLRNYNKRNYKQLIFCITLSVMLITSYSVMLYNPVIQKTLPIGGDSRRQVYMIFVLALTGCLIFTIYAASLFLKYKSRETGVFLALGARKSQLAKALYMELAGILLGCIIGGILLGGVVAYFVWNIFRLFLVNVQNKGYDFVLSGYGIAILFGIVVSLGILFMAGNYMKRTNLMDIMNAQRKSEPLRDVSKKYGLLGIVFLILGIVLGYGVTMIAGSFGVLMPAIWNVTYFLSLIGIYMVLVYTIVHHEKGRNPQKYYKNIVSFSMMKFQGRQTVRNMCIITLLIACSLFACFYPPQLYSGVWRYSGSPIDYAIPYKGSLGGIEEKIEVLAEEYGVEITEYEKTTFLELLGSGIERDWDDDGYLIEDYYKKYRYFEFISSSEYNRITGSSLDITSSEYYLIIAQGIKEGFWEKFDDLDYITNPITEEEQKVEFAGTVECQQLVRNGVMRYVLNDDDFANISKDLNDDRQVHQILFNVKDLEASYEFAKSFYEYFLKMASKDMAVMVTYDEYQEMLALGNGLNYSYSEPMELTSENPDLLTYWKYYPTMKILVTKTYAQNFAVFILLFIYVAIICLAAVGVISYTRSITIALNNKQLFDDLKKLGANNKYIMRTVIKQLNKIFVIPTVIGSLLIFTFTILIFFGNDGALLPSEMWAIGMDVFISVMVFVYQFIVYLFSLKKIKSIIGIKKS